MAEYRTPLPGLLAAALESGVNHVLALDAGSVDRLERLEGKVLQLDLEGLAITLYFSFAFGSVEVNLTNPRETEAPAEVTDNDPVDAKVNAQSDVGVDARVSGSPPALFALAAPDEAGDWGAPGTGVRIEGDATLARDLGKVFAQLDPDWQAPLNSLLGDVAGYQVAQSLKRGAAGLRESVRSLLGMTGRYLNDESDALAEQAGIDEFVGEVDDLRDGVDRFDARLNRMERQQRELDET